MTICRCESIHLLKQSSKNGHLKSLRFDFRPKSWEKSNVLPRIEHLADDGVLKLKKNLAGSEKWLSVTFIIGADVLMVPMTALIAIGPLMKLGKKPRSSFFLIVKVAGIYSGKEVYSLRLAVKQVIQIKIVSRSTSGAPICIIEPGKSTGERGARLN